jgi:DNA-binding HxlR family transcriptional regulator
METSITKKKMPETMYRASRFCRVLGNPTAYLILRCLERGRKTPGNLSKELKIPVSTISSTLRNLRQLELVRYETKGTRKVYWIKDLKVLNILTGIEEWVESMRMKRI